MRFFNGFGKTFISRWIGISRCGFLHSANLGCSRFTSIPVRHMYHLYLQSSKGLKIVKLGNLFKNRSVVKASFKRL